MNGTSPSEKPDTKRRVIAQHQELLRDLEVLRQITQRILTTLDEEKLIEEILKLSCEVFQADRAALMLYDKSRHELVIKTMADIQAEVEEEAQRIVLGREGIASWVASHRQSTIVPEVEQDPRYQEVFANVRSEMAAPILHGEQLLGVIDLQSSREAYFRDEHRPVLELLAGQIAVALHNSSLYEAQRRRAYLFSMLNHIARVAGFSLNREHFLKRIADSVRSSFGYFYTAIFLPEEGGERLQITAQSWNPEECKRFGPDTVDGDRGLVGNAYQLGMPIMVGDVKLDPRYIHAVEGVQSELCVPIRFGERVLGVLDVQSRHRDAFTHDDQLLIDTISYMVANYLKMTA